MNFFRLSIASVDDKQHLSEVVFSALVGISLLEKYPTLFFCEPSYASVNFSRLSIASVDGKQHLSEVIVSVLSDFHC